MKKRILALALLSSSVFASSYQVTEKNLVELLNEKNPSVQELESSFLNSQVTYEQFKDKFGFELYGGYNHNTTNERSAISFQPIFETNNQYKLGVKKYTKYGLVLDLSANSDMRTSHSTSTTYKDLTTTTYQFNVQMDLWKDLFGKLTRAQFDNALDMKKKDQMQKDISLSALKVNTRKMYWTLVANEEKLKITTNLLEIANKQASNARKRMANSITDKAEVARFESLVHQRRGQILLLKYEKEQLIKNLRNLFPTLNGREIELSNYNLNKTVFNVLACTAKIRSQKGVPYSSTKYDEITALLRTIKNRQKVVDNKYDDIDLKLDLKLKDVGVGGDADTNGNISGSLSKSLDDMRDEDRKGLSAGVIFTVPFGENKAATSKVLEKLSESRFEANIQKLDSNVIALHDQVKSSVGILTEVIKAQKANSRELSIRVKEMKKKYAQARIPEYALIQDQDSLLSSDLTVVDTQLRVVSIILDYFAVFNEFPCGFNKL